MLLFTLPERQANCQILEFLGVKKHSSIPKDYEPKESPKAKQARERAEKQKEKALENYEKAKAEDIKHRFNLQTPATKVRMLKNRKKADAFNNRYHESFLKKLIGKRKH
jgi:hypothetical protein